ncbi:MAG: tocopherol cyclase family protein [Firmicutes bacterium]|nr:tocopherol cyclase family protein [Bacillota bacterium]
MWHKKLVHPEYFQGNKKKNNYFEGWYNKFVSGDEKDTIAIIPGVSINRDDQHAFIQVFLSHNTGKDISLSTYYFKYAFEDFSFSHKEFWIRIGQNYFSNERVELRLRNENLSITGILTMHQQKPLQRSILEPNIMGIFGYLGFMECYHGVVSMSHELKGKLSLNQNDIQFNKGKGYIEKDWGKSFPSSYVWMQSNHFSNQDTSFMFSYASIPFIGLHFNGLIVNLVYQGKEYRFATYNGAKVKHELIGNGYVHYKIKKGKYLLDIESTSTTQIELASPRNGRMIEQIKEGLSGYIKLKLYVKDQLIYEDTGYHAGIEVMKK